ncbi:MAG: hypothetical protein SOZ45_01045 [Ruminococcus sp.]|nr:hypothetical protein [Ruminococcus sp.]
MKKLCAVFTAMLVALLSCATVFAAGINSAEQSILDKLNTTVVMQGQTMRIPTAYVNQAESYFNTVDVTEDQAKEINSIIDEGKKLLEQSGASNIGTLTVAQKHQLLDYGKKVVGVINMTMYYDSSTRNLVIKDPDGNIAFCAEPTLTKDGTIVSNDIVKTTGFGVNTVAAAGVAAVVVLVSAGVFVYAVKTRKLNS